MTQPPRKKQPLRLEPRVTLKTIADHLGLTPGTVSAALNNSPAARSIPEHTKNRIIEAAQALNYRPNFFARTLRLRRTYTIGVIAEEIGDAYGAMVISGIEEYLRKNDYFFLTVIHRHDPKLLQTYAQMLLTRGVEGFITTDQFSKEGPYGEWMGYYQDGYAKDRVVRIARIYHRDDPILLGCPQGKPPHEDNRFLVYLRSGMIWDQLEKAGVPGVCGVWCPPEAGNRLMTVVALKTQYLGHAKQAGLIASQCGGGIDMNRLTVVVDDHVDTTSLQDVIWSIVARCDPERGVEIIKDTKGSRIDMAIAPDKRELNANSRMIIDATTPFDWKNHPLAGDVISTPERTAKIHERWGWIMK